MVTRRNIKRDAKGRFARTVGRAASAGRRARGRRKTKWGKSNYQRSAYTGRYLTKKQSRNKRIITAAGATVGFAASAGLAGGAIALATHDVRKSRNATQLRASSVGRTVRR